MTRFLTSTLDSLAARGLRFTNARSNVPLTLPAHASIMTGTFPPLHGGRVNGTPVPDVRDTIASRLSRAGYRTGAVIGAFYILSFLGPILDLPDWVMSLSPFEHLALVPVAPANWGAAATMAVIAIAAALGGFAGYGRRDLV